MIGYFAVNLAYFRRFGKNDINNRMHARMLMANFNKRRAALQMRPTPLSGHVLTPCSSCGTPLRPQFPYGKYQD